MRILNARFIKSAADRGGWPRAELPEVAFAGRSNVGKSSLINFLTNRKNLAKTSETPGKTQLVNFFSVDERFNLVDLPGYGYARGGGNAKRQFDELTRAFFGQLAGRGDPQGGPAGAPWLAGALLLVDARHAGLESDLDAFAWLQGLGAPVTVVATKIDRLSRRAQAASRRAHIAALGVDVCPVSSRTGHGVRPALAALAGMLAR